MTGEFTIAVHALVYLSHMGITLDSEALAENVCTNAARVRKVMAKLKKSGIVATKEGASGGYSMERRPELVSLRDIGEALEVNFVKASWRSGSPDMDCLVASGMAALMDEIYGQLDELCRERLARITILDLNNKIFGGGVQSKK